MSTVETLCAETAGAAPDGDVSGLYEVIGKIHERAADPAGWEAILRDVAQLLAADYALLLRHERALGAPRLRAAYNAPPGLALADRGNGGHPSWLLRLDGLSGTGAVAEGWLPLAGDGRRLDQAIFACIAAEGSRRTVLALGRPEADGEFPRSTLRLAQRLATHLCAAWEVRQGRLRKAYVGQGTAEALNLLAAGVLIVDSGGRILARNESARAILQAEDGLSAAGGRLHMDGHAGGLDLAGLFGLGGPAEIAGPRPPVKLVTVARPSGRRPYSLLVCPLAGPGAALDEDERAALVFVSEPDHGPNGCGAELLTRIYGLTPAEARVAGLVAQGLRVQEIAGRLQITVNTARTHLKRVFEKTAVERQAELVQLLYGSVGLLRG